MVRVHALYPRVSSISNYIVQLILLDFQKGLVGPAEKKGKLTSAVFAFTIPGKSTVPGLTLQPSA